MSRVTVSFWFVVSVCLAFLFGRYTSTLPHFESVAAAQTQSPQTPSQPPTATPEMHRSTISGAQFSHSTTGLQINGSEPRFVVLEAFAKMDHITFDDLGEQRLDGIDCTDCIFDNVNLTYSGGAVNLVNPKLSGSIRLTLTGAAANGVILQRFLAAVAAGQKPEPANPNIPLITTANLKQPVVVNISTPFNGTLLLH